MISVAEKISATAVRQILNIGIESGKIRFYSGNGFTASDRSTFYSTYLQDFDEKKFLLDLSRFVLGMHPDPYSSGFLVKEINQF